MTMIGRTALALAALLSGMTAADDELRSWLAERAARQQFSGVVLAADRDRTLFEGAAGMSDRSASRANSIDTRFNVGSINKTFTAVAIAQLAQEGKLSFDDPIGKYLADYPNRDAAASVTIHHLLTHTSGIAPYTTGGLRGASAGASPVSELVALFAGEPLRFRPGSQQEYSNAGYVLLGRIVEVIARTTYVDYVSRHIYAPAGMRNTSFERSPTAGVPTATGYVALGPDGRPLMLGRGQRGMRGAPAEPPPSDVPPPLGSNADFVEPGNPAGGGYSTARDLVAFARALQEGRLLNATMTRHLLHGTFSGSDRPKYGYALREETINGHRFVGNGGGAPGINAEFRFEPAGTLAAVVLSNYSPPSATTALQRVLETITK